MVCRKGRGGEDSVVLSNGIGGEGVRDGIFGGKTDLGRDEVFFWFFFWLLILYSHEIWLTAFFTIERG